MATINVVLRVVKRRDEDVTEFPLAFQVSHDRKKRFIHIPFSVSESEWNEETQSACNVKSNKVRVSYIKEVNTFLFLQKKHLEIIIDDLQKKEVDFTAEDIVAAYNDNKDNRKVFGFIKSRVLDLRLANKPGTAYNYNSTYKAFFKFRKGEDLFFPQLTFTMVKDFEIFLYNNGLSTNTVSFYMRNLRAIYNKAIAQGIVGEYLYPFKRVALKTERTVKRAIDKDIIYKLKVMNLRNNPKLEWARDIFMFSFYSRGMSFVDMAYLKASNIKGDKIYYNRHKTRQLLQITITPQIAEIINRYKSCREKTGYLLPIIRRDDKSDYQQYKSALRLVNDDLKVLGRLISSPVPLSTYVARHSWATIAKKQGIPISVISEGMGHDNESTTRIYLAAFDTSIIDQANDIVTNI